MRSYAICDEAIALELKNLIFLFLLIIMGLTLLPYEILQQITSYLLPKYQCRIAITSHYCYQYLYNDMLRWHTHKAPLRIPKARHAEQISLHIVGDKLVCYTLYNHDKDRQVSFHNITDDTETVEPKFKRKDTLGMVITSVILDYNIEMFDGFYKYLLGRNFKYCASIRMSHILSLPARILCKIVYATLDTDSELIHVHPYLFEVFDDMQYLMRT